MNKWLPIETAPKDGTKVLVYGHGSYAVASYDALDSMGWRDNGEMGWDGRHGDNDQPTHWMPLPGGPV